MKAELRMQASHSPCCLTVSWRNRCVSLQAGRHIQSICRAEVTLVRVMQSGSKAHVSLTPYHRSLWYACCPHSALYSLTQLRKVTQSSALGVTLECRTGERRHSSTKSACLAPHQRDVIFAEISRVDATESFLTRTHSNAPTIWLLTAPFSLETPISDRAHSRLLQICDPPAFGLCR